MDIRKHTLNAAYKPAKKTNWEGRKSNPDIANQYWYQEIHCIDITEEPRTTDLDIAILGYVCDEGVRRNEGRIGSQEGPKAIRERLAKLPIHFENKRLADMGDIICLDGDMEACQELFSHHISNLIKQRIFPIAIGGGHDMAYAHFMGIWNAIKDFETKKIGIINFDAHFDLRPVEMKSNSGTPFHQIISELNKSGDQAHYFALGIQQQSNTKELFETAKNNHVDYVLNFDGDPSTAEFEGLKRKLNSFVEHVDYIYITIDMDGFSSVYAPGVSAPSPLGFTPHFVFKTLSFLFHTKKVISFDVAELNPSFDRDKITADLAARVIDFVVRNHGQAFP